MVTPDSTENSGPQSCPSQSRQRQAVAEEQAAHAEIVSSSQSAVAVKPAVETLGQLPREEPNKSSSPTRLCHDGKQQSATHIPQDPCASPKTQAVSRSLFGAPPSRSQLDALFGRERMQVSCSVYPLRATSGGRTTLSTTSLLQVLCAYGELTSSCMQSEEEFRHKWNFDVTRDQPIRGRWKYDSV